MAQSVTNVGAYATSVLYNQVSFIRLVIVQKENHISSSSITDCGIYFP
jgi:hypothetical protein